MTALHAAPAAPSPHEAAILRAIGNGATLDDLLKSPTWTFTDIDHTMRHHGLTVGEDGHPTRAPGTQPYLIHLARHSPSGYVRHAAGECLAQMRRLHEALNQYNADSTRDARREHDRQALELWREWLKTAARAASAEIRRLRPRTDGTTKGRS